jgi:hypothetical protein
MTLKIYVAKDSKGKEWAPDYPHEQKSIEWMLKKAWEDFHRLQMTYSIIVNMRNPSADMLILSERGLGVLELKHYFGEIKISNGTWFADTHPIDAGKYRNPRIQVQSYAKELRGKILNWMFPTKFRIKRDDIKFQTGVCFTNSNANVEKIQKNIAEKRPYPFEEWESDFSVIDINGFTAWARELRFQLQDRTKDFEPIRLTPEEIVQISTEVLGSIEWSEIYPAMPKGIPYAYLILDDIDGKQVFNITKDHSIIGRNPSCDVVIPERYGKVSNKHCTILRGVNGIEVKDMSSNGTFLNNKRINSETLQHGDILMLGGGTEIEKACSLKFELWEKTSITFLATEHASQKEI